MCVAYGQHNMVMHLFLSAKSKRLWRGRKIGITSSLIKMESKSGNLSFTVVTVLLLIKLIKLTLFPTSHSFPPSRCLAMRVRYLGIVTVEYSCNKAACEEKQGHDLSLRSANHRLPFLHYGCPLNTQSWQKNNADIMKRAEKSVSELNDAFILFY